MSDLLPEHLKAEAVQLLEGLLANALIGIYLIQDGLFRHVNSQFCETFGYAAAEICNRLGPEDLVFPDDVERVRQTLADRIEGRQAAARYTFHGRHRSGRQLVVEVFGLRIDVAGRPAVVGVLSDITARHVAERATAEQLGFIAQLIEAIPSPLFFKDAEARYLGCNQAFERFIGMAREAIIGKSVFEISPPDLAVRYHAADKALFDNPGVQTYEASVESSDGGRRDVLFNKATFLRGDGSMGGLVGVITDITERKRTEALIWAQANYDPLTGLPNRRLLNDRLIEHVKRADRDGSSVALLFIDLDRFKEVNDSLGHAAGDLLLEEAARRILACVRETDTVARQGGDEFAVLLPGLHEHGPIERIAEAILRILGEPFAVGADECFVSASIGITLYPRDATSPADLFKNADQAMYHAKDNGRSRFSYFSPALQEAALHHLQLGRDLRQAIAGHQLRVEYQPIYHLASGALLKAEALLRWTHPTRGEIGPAEFIPTAEEIGLIDEIGDWVFARVTETLLRWRATLAPGDAERCPLQITVNTSPRQFTGGRSVEAQLDRMDAAGLPGACIALEITESLLLGAQPRVADRLARLSARGVQVSLDDFGTGYSAMAYLKRLDIDTLKIDRSFVRDLTTDSSDLAIAEAIIAMAHKLGLDVVAEGIETDEQRRILAATGCDFGQGYLFARPLSEDALLTLLEGQRRALATP